jgi:hypothetical protein
MENYNESSSKTARPGARVRPDIWKLLAVLALAIIAICSIIATVTLGRISERIEGLYNVTALPHCYLSPNDPRRREIQRNWGSEPTTEGACDAETRTREGVPD